jgi:hypothetical protein
MATVAIESKHVSPAIDEPNVGVKDESEGDRAKLTELLTETRILLPGTEVFLGFLATLPFSQHFGQLDHARRVVYICTFLATLLALILFVVPASYHRLARPIRHKERFKSFANKFLVAGLVPMSIAMVLASYLITYVVLNRAALAVASVVGSLIVLVWWVVPLIRAHDRWGSPAKGDEPHSGQCGGA